MAGYSGKPLVKKLGIKEGSRVALVHSPKGFKTELGTLPARAKLVSSTSDSLDVILLFVKSEADLKKEFAPLATDLVGNGMLWIVWPKKSSGVATDLSFTNVQKVGLNAGLVDVKICAVNDIWSGLKFVYRLRDRARR
jgi:hypothetical protein